MSIKSLLDELFAFSNDTQTNSTVQEELKELETNEDEDEQHDEGHEDEQKYVD